MPDSDLPDYRTPVPDRGHEALRQVLARAIDNLAAIVADLDETRTGQDDAFYLVDLLFEMVDGLYADVSALNIRADAAEIRENTAQSGINGLQETVAALVARVEALEAGGLTGPDAAG